jgi:hypothetical protein
MRHIPLPPGHRVSTADRLWAADLLRTTDAHGILAERERVLRRLLALLRSLRLGLSEITLIECGAHQQDPPVEDEWEYNPAISHFMALHAESLGLEYRAFDPGYTPEKLDREFACALAETDERYQTPLFVRRPDLAPVLAERVKAVSLSGYDDVVRLARETPKATVLFSSHVLNDPDRTDDFPFWQLPGLHHHSASLAEMTDVLPVDEPEGAEAAAPEDAPDLQEMAARLIAGSRDAHLAAFREVFGLRVPVRRRFGRDLLVRYEWSAA